LALLALRVMPIVMHDVTPQVVVIGVNPGHDVKSGIGEDTNPARRGAEPAGLAASAGRTA